MSAYVIVEFTVKDPEIYRDQYGHRWKDRSRARRRSSRRWQLGDSRWRNRTLLRGGRAVSGSRVGTQVVQLA